MLENVTRQIALVFVLIAASIVSLTVKELNWGNDLAGGTELIYEVDRKKVEEDNEKESADPINWDEFMSTTVGTIARRIDPEGVLNAEVLRRGDSGIYIGLPTVGAAELAEIEAKITRLGTLRMQICAYEDYENDEGEQIFDLTKERDRLQAWIAESGNKERLIKDPLDGIELYHNTSTENGGPILGPDKLKWIPHKIEGRIQAGGERASDYDLSYSKLQNKLAGFVVKLFEDADLEKEAKEGDYLLEYLPVNFDEKGFTGKDLIANKVAPSTDPQTGSPVVVYEIVPAEVDRYADLSEANIGNQSAIILDGFIKSAPVYESRIPGRGQIRGFTQPEALALSEVLKRGSLKVKPEFQSRRTVGPTLGAESIEKGVYSLIIGSVVVLGFILFYYRLAGIIATLGLMLNIGFVFGAVSFIGATLTLPGLGGLVLTVGMAVDANILIYERIREEIKTGKELLQAVRHGFERAMVTILDANVTTFIAGLVLYNFGVGPIRGFAVTLMVGIVTSLFTAFFFSRLLFHFLLQRKTEKLHMLEWFSHFRFNFLRLSKPALLGSAVVIISGLVMFFQTAPGEKYALDFTGGADVRVVLRDPVKPDAISKLIEDSKDFQEAVPSTVPQINTTDTNVTADGKARKFSIKLKVSPALQAKIDKEKAEADAKDEVYYPPYVDAIGKALASVLVPQAFTDASIIANPEGRTNFASIVVHYAESVPVEKIHAGLVASIGGKPEDVEVSAWVGGKKDTATKEASDLLLEFDVSKKIDTPGQLVTYTDQKLQGTDVELSNPIPDVATLGGRMVGELKSAAIGAMLMALFCIVMYIRLRFREYKYGLAAVTALAHDVLVALGLVVVFNKFGLVNAELSLSMIAAFLTIIGYSINDTIVIFDRIRENLTKQANEGDTDTSFADTVNLSINQTLGRTILTSFTTLFVVTVLFTVNYGAGSELEGFAFAMIIGVFTGTYSTIFVASPVVLWLRSREKPDAGLSDDGGLGELGPIEGEAEATMPVATN